MPVTFPAAADIVWHHGIVKGVTTRALKMIGIGQVNCNNTYMLCVEYVHKMHITLRYTTGS